MFSLKFLLACGHFEWCFDQEATFKTGNEIAIWQNLKVNVLEIFDWDTAVRIKEVVFFISAIEDVI